MFSAAANALLGFLFWAVAAHYYGPTDIGIATALLAAATLVGSLGYLGFDYALLRFLPGSTSARADSNTALTVTGAGSLIIAVIYILVAAAAVPKLSFLLSSPLWFASFMALCLLTTWNYLTNCIFIANRVAQYVLFSTLIFSVLRFPFEGLLRHHGRVGLVATWLLSILVGNILSFALLFRHDRYTYRPLIRRETVKKMASYAGGSYLSNIFGGVTPLVLPTLIVAIMGPKEGAYFYIVYLMTTSLNMIPTAVSQSFLAEGAHNDADLGDSLRKASRVIVGLMVPAIIVLAVAGEPVLRLFGPAYAKNGFGCLLLLCVTAIPKMGSYLLGTVLRVHNQVRPLVVVATCGTAVALAVSSAGLVGFRSLTIVGFAFLMSELVVCISYVVLVRRRYPAVLTKAFRG